MKAIVLTQYGSSDTLSLQEVDRPILTDNNVLIKVHATSINSGDWHLMRGEPFIVRLIYGLLKPKVKILGFDVAGQVEAVGKAVTQFKPGDEVFGDLSECGFGAFAEYVCPPESALVHKPMNTSFEEAAAVPGAALTALQGLRDVGQLQPGQRVLINGASGGVGSFAVQIAKILGAEVTAVCSTKKIEKVRSLGADYVIDYTQTDITQARQQYDLMLDAAAFRSVFDYLPGLVSQGTYVMVGGSTVRLFQVLLFGSVISRISDRKVKSLVVKPNQTDLLTLKAWIEAGHLTPLIDQCYPFSELPTAIRYVEQRQVTGKVAIRV
ncbi:MAG: NAD(P)-dependent alcohol dehydrogenase [Leptolyngbya sp. Prado105]|jgi:NADPH:quinone reductase-like Zn-dependent oxidoreductase|nr:NAD(P)-dependent alcohol dehydrogenase [Leptolyngbya sp. Prado105]